VVVWWLGKTRPASKRLGERTSRLSSGQCSERAGCHASCDHGSKRTPPPRFRSPNPPTSTWRRARIGKVLWRVRAILPRAGLALRLLSHPNSKGCWTYNENLLLRSLVFAVVSLRANGVTQAARQSTARAWWFVSSVAGLPVDPFLSLTGSPVLSGHRSSRRFRRRLLMPTARSSLWSLRDRWWGEAPHRAAIAEVGRPTPDPCPLGSYFWGSLLHGRLGALPLL
jgi:hypothetical protein